MLKEDTSPLPQEDARSHERPWKPEHSLSRRPLKTYPDIAARFLQYSTFLVGYSSVPAGEHEDTNSTEALGCGEQPLVGRFAYNWANVDSPKRTRFT